MERAALAIFEALATKRAALARHERQERRHERHPLAIFEAVATKREAVARHERQERQR